MKILNKEELDNMRINLKLLHDSTYGSLERVIRTDTFLSVHVHVLINSHEALEKRMKELREIIKEKVFYAYDTED